MPSLGILRYGSLSAAQLLVLAGCDLAHRLTGGTDEGMNARELADDGKGRVYNDPRPGRSVRASHSADATPGRGRIDSQHAAVAQLLARAERAVAGARQRLAFACVLLEGGVESRRGLVELPRSVDGGSDLIHTTGGDGTSIIEQLSGIELGQRLVDKILATRHEHRGSQV